MIIDADAVQGSPLVSGLDAQAQATFARHLDPLDVADGASIVRQGEPGRELFLVLCGAVVVERDGVRLAELGPGAHFGEISLLTDRPRAASATAVGDVSLGRLTREGYEALAARAPAVAARIIREIVAGLGRDLVRIDDGLGLLLRERSLPRRAEIDVTVRGERRRVAMGTPVGQVLSPPGSGALLVAALVDRKPVSLRAPLTADAEVEPLTTDEWEGREVFRRSAGLLVLEAARRVAPEVAVRIGPSLSSSQLVEVDGCAELEDLAARLTTEVRAIAARRAAFVEEMWTVEEAMSHFTARGWTSAAKVLSASRDAAVPLVTAGEVYALCLAPLLPDASSLVELSLRPYHGMLLLEFGATLGAAVPPGAREQDADGGAPARSAEMLVAHKAWLATLGVGSVGDFNQRAVDGGVSELIRAAEGFHEKRIGRIADLVEARGPGLRIISIAGPSSSGKTTFIKRLKVQLQINGVRPRAVSLDDYYLSRDRTPRGPDGERDFEALGALDLPLLQAHLGALLRGEGVRTARYDFLSGTSLPSGGEQLQLGPRDVLMIEGIHGLNPALVGAAARAEQVFRVFIHPMIDLPFDHLSSVNPADVRLLRRIVRDRHGRGHAAADTIARWPSVRDGERRHIFPFLPGADAVFDSSLAYECSVLKVYADRYLLEVPRAHPSYTTAHRLRRLIDRFVTIYPDHVPPTSILREFIGGSGFEY